MNLENRTSWSDNEHGRLMKIINFRFPNKYKSIALISAVAIFAFLVVYKYYGANDILIKDLSRTVMLLLLLMASLSKDSVEDEYINHVRSQSYTLAFLCATAYSIGLPIIAFLMDILITNISNDGIINFHEVSAFEVLFMLICFQLLFFENEAGKIYSE